MKKRSVSIKGHATSISLEDAFWHAVQELARQRNMSVAGLITEIDAQRQTSLSSAIRLCILESLQEKVKLMSLTHNGQNSQD